MNILTVLHAADTLLFGFGWIGGWMGQNFLDVFNLIAQFPALKVKNNISV
jgi:hypothetical protein